MTLTVKGRQYFIDGEQVPSVTTLIGDGLAKPGLEKWAAETTAAYAVDRWDELAELPISQRLEILQNCRFGERDAAAGKGTAIHKLAEKLIEGQEVDVPEALRDHVDHCVALIDRWNLQLVLVERPVFNRRWRYAGRPDLVADLNDGRRLLIDWKTKKSAPWGDEAFQMSGYRYAEVFLDDADQEQPMPNVDGCAIGWLRADGADLIEIKADESVFRQFLYIAWDAKAAHAAHRCHSKCPPALRDENGGYVGDILEPKENVA